LGKFFEILFLIWAAYAFVSLFFLSMVRKSELFSFKTERALYLAQLMAIYIIIDSVCLLYMSLATFCVIKLCLTATWKVSLDPVTDTWRFTTQGVPHRLRRYLVSFVLIPLVIVHDICY